MGEDIATQVVHSRGQASSDKEEGAEMGEGLGKLGTGERKPTVSLTTEHQKETPIQFSQATMGDTLGKIVKEAVTKHGRVKRMLKRRSLGISKPEEGSTQ